MQIGIPIRSPQTLSWIYATLMCCGCNSASRVSVAVPGTVLNLAVPARTNSSMTVTWDAPSVGGETGYYNVTIKGTGTFKTESFDRKTTRAEFKDLTAGTAYTVSVVTVIGDLQSTVVERTFYTGKYDCLVVGRFDFCNLLATDDLIRW